MAKKHIFYDNTQWDYCVELWRDKGFMDYVNNSPKKKERIIKLYFGLDDGEPKTVKEVAERLFSETEEIEDVLIEAKKYRDSLIEKRELKNRVELYNRILLGMSDEKRKIIFCMYGLFDGKLKSIRETAEVMNYTFRSVAGVAVEALIREHIYMEYKKFEGKYCLGLRIWGFTEKDLRVYFLYKDGCYDIGKNDITSVARFYGIEEEEVESCIRSIDDRVNRWRRQSERRKKSLKDFLD